MRKLIPPLKDKRGDFTGILFFIVSIAAFAIVLLIGGYIADNVGREMKNQIGSDRTEVNNSFETTIKVARNTLPALWYVVFVGLLLGLFITAWFMPTHPIMVAPFIILLVIAVIVGVGMSNAYQELYEVQQFSNMTSRQGGIEFMMNNLPVIAVVVGIITLIITFAKPGGNAAPMS